MPVLVLLDHGVDDPAVVCSSVWPRVRQRVLATLGVPFAGQAHGFVHLGTADWLLSVACAPLLTFAAGYHLMV